MDLVEMNSENEPVTTSLKVAECFNQKHEHILDSIETILRTFGKYGFEEKLEYQPVFYTDSKNCKKMAYEMNRKGFMILTVRFDGEEAIKFKNDFVDAFDYMKNRKVVNGFM